MGSSNASVIRRIWELFNSLDPDESARRGSLELEALQSLFDPEVEFTQPASQIDAEEFHGRRDFLQSWNEWLNLWTLHRSEIIGIEERGDTVLVVSHERYTARDGLELERDVGSVLTLSNGRVTRFQAFLDEEPARQVFEAEVQD